eukprot:m.172822 g.172822  ORF g.172822 m.172822 type:complete len:336 (+) comp10403_c0_seq10:956-1963(+)
MCIERLRARIGERRLIGQETFQKKMGWQIKMRPTHCRIVLYMGQKCFEGGKMERQSHLVDTDTRAVEAIATKLDVVLRLESLVVVDDFANICALQYVWMREKGALEAANDNVLELLGIKVECIQSQTILATDGGVGNGTVVGADADTETVCNHLLHLVLGNVVVQLWDCLEVACQADLKGRAVFGDILDQVVDVALAIRDIRADLVGVEEMKAMTNALGMQIGQSLENRLRPVTLAGMDSLVDKCLVRHVVCVFVRTGGKALLRTSNVECNNRQVHLLLGLEHSRNQRRRSEAKKSRRLLVLMDTNEVAVVLRRLFGEEAHGAGNDAILVARVLA